MSVHLSLLTANFLVDHRRNRCLSPSNSRTDDLLPFDRQPCCISIVELGGPSTHRLTDHYCYCVFKGERLLLRDSICSPCFPPFIRKGGKIILLPSFFSIPTFIGMEIGSGMSQTSNREKYLDKKEEGLNSALLLLLFSLCFKMALSTFRSSPMISCLSPLENILYALKISCWLTNILSLRLRLGGGVRRCSGLRRSLTYLPLGISYQ